METIGTYWELLGPVSPFQKDLERLPHVPKRGIEYRYSPVAVDPGRDRFLPRSGHIPRQFDVDGKHDG